MPISLKALIFVLPFVGVVFYLARPAFRPIIDPKTVGTWALFFCTGTIAIFLVQNFWLCLLVLMAIAWAAIVPGRTPAAIIFIFILFMLPADEMAIPGFAGMRQVIPMSAARASVLLFLIPALLNRKDEPRTPRALRRHNRVDTAFILFLLIGALLAFRDTTYTNGFRGVFQNTVLVAPVFFVFSRLLKTEEQLRQTMAAYAICLTAMGAVAFVEFLTQWHQYEHVRINWDLSLRNRYVTRAGSIRAFASIGEAISFGNYLAIALMWLYALLTVGAHKWLTRLAIVGVITALMCTLSRTPWLISIVGTIAFIMTGPNALPRLAKLGVMGVLGFLVLLITPFGDTIIGLIPGLSSSDAASDTFNYRQDLFGVGLGVLLDNWMFGVSSPEEHPGMQSLRQGQGIVDIVNSYLYIGLRYGVPALMLFLFVQGASLLAVFRAIREARVVSPQLSALNRGLFAGQIAYLICLMSMSWQVGHISTISFILAAMSISASRVTARVVAEAKERKTAGIPLTDDAPQTAGGKEPAKRPPSLAGQDTAIGQRPLPAHMRQYARPTGN